jgi:chlorophyll synthase
MIEYAVPTARRLPVLAHLTRPWFWPLSWGGAYLGTVLATRSWLPPPEAVPRSLAALLVLGPLVWGAVLAVNDRHDIPGDRRNPRKAHAPLVTGALTPADVHRFGLLSAAAALLVAVAIGPAFAAGTAAVLLLGHLYSAPPVRLKSRPGADVAVNALVVGVLGPLAGWTLHRPATDFPPPMILLGLLLAAALYLPTTVLDLAADRAAGDRTAAVRWQPRACYRAGLTLWAAAIALWLICCHQELLAPGTATPTQTLMAPILLAAYAAATRAPTIARMAGVTLLFAIPAADFLHHVTGP